MGNLELGAFVTQDRKVFAPVELECLTQTKGQRHEGTVPCRLLLSLPIWWFSDLPGPTAVS
jgi:hypothetical protein